MLAALLELALGYGLRNPRLIPDSLLTSYRKLYESEDRNIFQVTDCAEYDPDLFYRFKTGKCAFTNREFDVMNEINSQGLRDDEGSLDNPSIVIFGDSFAMGWGVPQANCFPQVLESLSGQKVLNAGVSSFGTAREMKLLSKLGYQHINTVIIQYHPNDYEENLTSIQNNFNLPVSPQRTYDSLKQNIFERNQYFPFKYLKGISKSVAFSMLRPEKASPSDTVEARAFLDILSNSNIHNVAGRIFVFKTDNRQNGNGFVDALDHLLLDARFANLNITTVRIDGIMNKEDYFILDAHFNAAGHQKLAAKLHEYIQQSINPVMAGNPPGTGGKEPVVQAR